MPVTHLERDGREGCCLVLSSLTTPNEREGVRLGKLGSRFVVEEYLSHVQAPPLRGSYLIRISFLQPSDGSASWKRRWKIGAGFQQSCGLYDVIALGTSIIGDRGDGRLMRF